MTMGYENCNKFVLTRSIRKACYFKIKSLKSIKLGKISQWN